MVRLKKAVARVLALVMAGSMVCIFSGNAGGLGNVYAAETAAVDDSHTHSFTRYISDNNATCQHAGTRTAQCDYGCGATDKIADPSSPKVPHSFTNYISDNNATCNELGTMSAMCDYGCGEKNIIPDENSTLKNHKFTKYVSNHDATCTVDGTKTAQCDYGCGETKTVTDKNSKVAHNLVGEWIVTQKASPEGDGILSKKCKNCGTVVNAAKIPAVSKIVLDSGRIEYNGKAKKMGVRVLDVKGQEIDASQYTLTFSNNIAAGKAVVKAVFSGDYKGSITKDFYIYPRAAVIRTLTNTAAGITVSWSKVPEASGYTVYRSTNGGAYKNIGTVRSAGGVKYTDTSAKTNAAKYVYKIVAYKTGSTYTINAKASAGKVGIYLSAPKCTSAVNAAAGSLKVVYSQNTKAGGYQIQYSLNDKFTGSKTVNIANYKTTSAVLKKLQKGKKYYVRVRGYKIYNKVTYFSDWSNAKSVSIKK